MITENESITEQDEEDNFIVVESQNTVVIEETVAPVPMPLDTKPAADEDHGHLVAQILETQKELEDESRLPNQSTQSKKVEIVSKIRMNREVTYL